MLSGSFDRVLEGHLRLRMVVGTPRDFVFGTVEPLYASFLRHFGRISPVVSIEGRTMFLDPSDALRLSITGEYDPEATSLVKKNIRQGDVVLDIGANIGHYTLLFSELVGPTGRVYAFEPEPEIFGILRKNVQVNQCKNVVLVQKAVSDRCESTTMFSDGGIGSCLYDPHKGLKPVGIETIRIDDFLRDHEGGVDFVKVDIEGAECAALKGAMELLTRQSRLTVLTEFNPYKLRRFGSSPTEYLRLLQSMGLELFEIARHRYSPTRIDSVDDLLNRTGNDCTNLPCVKMPSSC